MGGGILVFNFRFTMPEVGYFMSLAQLNRTIKESHYSHLSQRHHKQKILEVLSFMKII